MKLSKKSFYYKKPDIHSPSHTIFSFILAFCMILIHVPIIQACFLTWLFGHYFDFSQIYMYNGREAKLKTWARWEKLMFTSEGKYDFVDTFVFNLLGVLIAGAIGDILRYAII